MMISEPKLSHAGSLIDQNASFMFIAVRYFSHFRILSTYNIYDNNVFEVVMLFCRFFLKMRDKELEGHVDLQNRGT